MIKITCPKCKKTLTESEYNLDSLISQCNNCQTVSRIDITDALTSDKSYKEVTKPKGIEVKYANGVTTYLIKYKYFNSYLLLFFISAFTCAAMFQINNINSVSYFDPINLSMLTPFIFPLLLLYWGLTIMLKTTTIKVTEHIVSFHTGSSISLKKSKWHSKKYSINQLFVRRRKIENENSTSIVFDLLVELNNDQTQVLISDFKSAAPLYYLETQLEKLLNIEDKTHKLEAKDSSYLPKNLKEVISFAKNIYEAKKEIK